MPTTFVKGDLFEDGADPTRAHAFAFSADISGSMSTGIAVAFAKRWPTLAEAYRAHASTGKMQLGDVFGFAIEEPGKPKLVIYALGIQHGEKKPKVSSVVRTLERLIAKAEEDGISRLALPRIGAGKGGADRVRVKKILTEAGEGTSLGLVVFEQFVRARPAEPAT